MADFYAARDTTMMPLPWPSIAPPITTIRAALVGNDRDENIFALTQSLEFYDFYQTKLLECDRRLETVLAGLAVDKDHDATKLPQARTKRKQVNTPSFDVRAALYGVLGTDLTQIHGLGPSLALKLVGECGTNLKAWPSAKHFTMPSSVFLIYGRHAIC